MELIGFVEDIHEPLAQYSVFVCPILSGSGVRVKLLEAFAAGIPVVSTTLGAEGLASGDTGICRIADKPANFADAVLDVLNDPEQAQAMAAAARAYVVAERDMRVMTHALAESYRLTITEMRAKQARLSPAAFLDRQLVPAEKRRGET